MALMIPIRPLLHLTLFLLLLAQLSNSVLVPEIKSHAGDELKPKASSTYIVLVDPPAKPSQFATHDQWYTSMVASASPTTNSSRVFYVYDTVVNGFAAEITDDQARRLADTTGVAGVYKDRVVPLHTTRSPGFLGLDKDFGIWPDTEFGDGVVIGFVDSGIWPESDSFSDAGLGPVRSSWKGRCVDGERFNASMCNNKLVGARYFVRGMPVSYGEFQSPRDAVGHGTHVSSTAAGSEVPAAEFLEFAKGTARGVAPKARVAMYKACDVIGCGIADIVAAVNAAVKDGVDILSLSIGSDQVDEDFHKDPVSIALFGAARAGVFVACSAGNKGPEESSLNNVAPWITTVGAATVDRVFPVSVTLGDGQVLAGQSLYAQKANKTEMLRLVPSLCRDDEELVPDRIMGKVVVCRSDVDDLQYSISVQNAGGSGLLTLHLKDRRMDGLMAYAFTLPAASLSSIESQKLMTYLHSVPYPVASFRFTGQTVTGENRAPVVASFSSRGPNNVAREILKPDVIAPGLNILAAWPDKSSRTLTTDADDSTRRPRFNIDSGTSMACPHVAGVAALLRHKHRDWTPAMIRSAIMTTATTLDSRGLAIEDNGLRRGGRATPMAVGSGLVQPRLAIDPGLVYDAAERDYVEFLCTLNYTTAQIRLFVPGFAGCGARTLPGGVSGLNYPSFVVAFGNGTDAAVRVVERTVTKVSEGAETYTVKVEAPKQLVAVTVTPATLEFGEHKNEKKSYKVVFRSRRRSSSAGARGAAKSVTRFGSIVWKSEAHQVKSPVVFMWG